MSDIPVRILVVDDEVPQMRAICDTLQDYGYVTVGFNRGQAALEAFQPGTFDLLLADLMMPEMDGITLLQAVLEKDSDVIGIIMTGAGTIATAVDAMKAGAFDYLLKPFRLSEILPVLSRALAMRRLRQENAELQRGMRERTAELEIVNRDLEAFSYSVSHDLRAPLRAISGFAEILVEEHQQQLPTTAHDLLKRVVSNARNMDLLINGLLRFSQLGRQPLTKAPVDVAALVKEVLDEQRKERESRELEVRIGDLPDCIGDRVLLRQVFVNLISNAFKYTRRKPRALVEIGSRHEGGETIYFVRDDGAGFDMASADKLFAVFGRLHRGDEFEGTGVGLSVVQRIIQRHGGRIWAEAAVGQGATFSFTVAEPEPTKVADKAP